MWVRQSSQSHLEDLPDEVPDQRQRQPSELVLLEQLVQVDAQQLENQTKMVLELEAVQQPDDVLRVVGVVPLVQLPIKGFKTSQGACAAGVNILKRLTATDAEK